MRKQLTNKPNVFISYSWDSTEHQKWVLELADLINENGGNAIVDRTHLKYGGHIKTFMLKNIIDSDIVLMILTPKYKEKADNLQGGAGFEYNIINEELFKIITTNEKFIPILRDGDLQNSVTFFLRGFNCVDLRDGDSYHNNLEQLLKQISSPISIISPTLSLITTSMATNYKDLALLLPEMKKNAWKYFNELFLEKATDKRTALEGVLKTWEKDISEYHSTFVAKFGPSKMKLYSEYLEDFKGNVFAKELWTVKAALKTRDPDLARYKKDFKNADNQEIFDTVSGILKVTSDYAENTAQTINYAQPGSVEDLKMDYLNDEEMFMNRVIGFGIRSEILHRYFPAYFPIMTQPNLWAMYFICESANEFITVEHKVRAEKMRVSHNWQYPYDRFAFIMNAMANELFGWFKQYNLNLRDEYRFGYANMFLRAIREFHKADVELLHEWVETK